MAFENQFGINKGAAQVLDFTPIAKTYQYQLQQSQLRRQKEEEALAAQIAKINSKGIRPEDRAEFTRRYNEGILATNNEYNNAKDKATRLVLKAKVNQQQEDLVGFINDSIAAGEKFKQYGSAVLQDKDGRLMPEWLDNYKSANSLSIADPKFVDLYKKLETTPYKKEPLDFLKYEDAWVNRSVQEIDKQEKTGYGQSAKYVNISGKRLDPDMLLGNIQQQLQGKEGEEFAKFISDNFGVRGDGTADPQDIISYRDDVLKRRAKQFNISRKEGGFVEREARQSSGGGDGIDEATYRQQLIFRAFNGDKTSLDEIQAYLPNGSRVEFKVSGNKKDGRGNQVSKGGYNFIRVETPERIDENGNVIPAYKEDISFSKGDPMNRMNAIINEATGENIYASKLNIVGGKPRGKKIYIKPNNPKQSGGKNKDSLGIL